MSRTFMRALAALAMAPVLIAVPSAATAQAPAEGLLSVTTAPAVSSRIIVDSVVRSDW